MSDVIYRELINDMTWSYSRVSCFEDCPYKWFVKYIHQDEEAPMFFSSYGSFLHKLIEYYYRGIFTKEEIQTMFLTEYHKKIIGCRPPINTVKKYINEAIEYLDSFEPFPYEMVAVEKEIRFDINGTEFIGYIDFLGKDENGDLYIVDNKSRILKPRSSRVKPTQNDLVLDKMLRQLYLYAEGIKREFGKYPKALCFNCFRSNTLIVEPFDEAKHKEALEWAGNLIEEIKDTSDFVPNVEFFQCKYLCGYNNDCCYWQGMM